MRLPPRSLVRGDASAEDRLSAIHALARATLALVFLWHGMVPKLLFRHADELALLRDSGLSEAAAARMVVAIGVAEVVFGLALLLAWRVRVLLLLIPVAMLAMTLSTAAGSPRFIPAAFTPITLNLCVAALAITAAVSIRHGKEE
jgi:hypothetical protein